MADHPIAVPISSIKRKCMRDEVDAAMSMFVIFPILLRRIKGQPMSPRDCLKSELP